MRGGGSAQKGGGFAQGWGCAGLPGQWGRRHGEGISECAGLDVLMTLRVHRALAQPVESTRHDVRWGEEYGGQYVWGFLISGAAPGFWRLRIIQSQTAMR